MNPADSDVMISTQVDGAIWKLSLVLIVPKSTTKKSSCQFTEVIKPMKWFLSCKRLQTGYKTYKIISNEINKINLPKCWKQTNSAHSNMGRTYYRLRYTINCSSGGTDLYTNFSEWWLFITVMDSSWILTSKHQQSQHDNSSLHSWK